MFNIFRKKSILERYKKFYCVRLEFCQASFTSNKYQKRDTAIFKKWFKKRRKDYCLLPTHKEYFGELFTTPSGTIKAHLVTTNKNITDECRLLNCTFKSFRLAPSGPIKSVASEIFDQTDTKILFPEVKGCEDCDYISKFKHRVIQDDSKVSVNCLGCFNNLLALSGNKAKARIETALQHSKA